MDCLWRTNEAETTGKSDLLIQNALFFAEAYRFNLGQLEKLNLGQLEKESATEEGHLLKPTRWHDRSKNRFKQIRRITLIYRKSADGSQFVYKEFPGGL